MSWWGPKVSFGASTADDARQTARFSQTLLNVRKLVNQRVGIARARPLRVIEGVSGRDIERPVQLVGEAGLRLLKVCALALARASP